MQITRRSLVAADATDASALIHHSFASLSARDWAPAASAAFLEESSPSGLAKAIASCFYSMASFADARMVGIIVLPNPNTVSLLFVDPGCSRKGVARSLWAGAREFLESLPDAARTVRLYATPSSVPFYRSVGFGPASVEATIKGCRVTPMTLQLSSRPTGQHAR
jgi:GNAT superfamily N-acetyltransferase